MMQSHNPEVRRPRFGLFPLRSPLLRESIFLSFPQGNEMFQFPWLSSITYGFSYGSLNITSMRLPHSDISGSKPAYGSPKLFAVNHVLLRLLAPRHSPYALSIFAFVITSVFLSLLGNCNGFSHFCNQPTFFIQKFSINFFTMQFSKNYSPYPLGGDKRDRTAGLLLARQALSQLSYTPV